MLVIEVCLTRLPTLQYEYILILTGAQSFTGPYKRAYIAALQRLLWRCCNPRSAAIHEVECSSAHGLRHLMDNGSRNVLVDCGNATFKFVAAAMHEPQSTRSLMFSWIAAARGLWLPQLAGVGRF